MQEPLRNPFSIQSLKTEAPEDKPFFIKAYAAEAGVKADVAIVAAAALFNGIHPHAQSNILGFESAGVGLNLFCLLWDYPLVNMISGLTRSFREMQDCLRRNSQSVISREIDEARYGGHSRNHRYLDAIKSDGRTSSSVPTPDDALHFDLRDHVEMSLVAEKLQSPNFMCGNGDPAPFLRGCHRGRLLQVGNPGPWPSSPRARLEFLNRYSKFLHGCTEKLPGGNYTTPVTSRTNILHSIFTATKAQAEFLISEDREFLNSFLMVSSHEEEISDDSSPARQEQAGRFLNLFHRCLKHALALRRAGINMETGFHKAAAAREFERQQRLFFRDLGQNPLADLTQAAARLPSMIAVALSALGGERDLDDYILDTAIPVFRVTVRNVSCTTSSKRCRSGTKAHSMPRSAASSRTKSCCTSSTSGFGSDLEEGFKMSGGYRQYPPKGQKVNPEFFRFFQSLGLRRIFCRHSTGVTNERQSRCLGEVSLLRPPWPPRSGGSRSATSTTSAPPAAGSPPPSATKSLRSSSSNQIAAAGSPCR